MPEDHIQKAAEEPIPGAPPTLPAKVPSPTPHPATASASKGPGPGDMKDSTREVIETVVFVVVLVLLLKTFLAEAFVIPTGSMATTLLGYHLDVTCDMCGYPFVVNASKEVEVQVNHQGGVESEVATKA